MKKKILIIDDDQAILDALELMLTDAGFDTQTVSSGEKVIDMIQTYIPNIILLDVLISGTDGRDIVKKLKDTPKIKDIPVIMLSAHPNIEKTVEEAGADDFLSKPFNIDDLLSLVSKYIRS